MRLPLWGCKVYLFARVPASPKTALFPAQRPPPLPLRRKGKFFSLPFGSFYFRFPLVLVGVFAIWSRFRYKLMVIDDGPFPSPLILFPKDFVHFFLAFLSPWSAENPFFPFLVFFAIYESSFLPNLRSGIAPRCRASPS